jgi:hypothetical protein
MEDITNYTNQELSLLVFNTEYLYAERHNRQTLMALINSTYKYTDNQMAELISDLDADQEES